MKSSALCDLTYTNSERARLGGACSDLHKRYGDVVAVDGLSLDVQRGECFGLLGPNGAGKTTTIEILEGLLAPDAGDVEVLGLRWRRDERELRQRLGIQLQETQLADKLTVEETLRLFRSFYDRGTDDRRTAAARRAREQATRAGWSSCRADRSSGCRSRARSPAIRICCFSTSRRTGLDPQSRRQLWDVLERFRSDGGTILLTTHYMDEAEVLCDRVAIVDHGTIIALGTPQELIAGLTAPQGRHPPRHARRRVHVADRTASPRRVTAPAAERIIRWSS